MDDELMNQIFQVFKEILNTLNLQDDIIGYICCLVFLCVVLMVKIFTFSIILRKLRSCKGLSDLEQLEMQIIWKYTMQGLEYMLIASAVLFVG